MKLRVGLALIIVVLAVYSLITEKDGLLPYTFLLLGIMFILSGINELRKKHKILAFIIFLASVFIIFVSVRTLFIQI